MAGGLPEQAVKLPHLAHGRLSPTVRSNDRFYLFPKCRNTLGHSSEIIQDVRHALTNQCTQNVSKV